LRGDDSWSHQFAGPGNTGCSEDALARPPFGILWFGDPGPEKMAYRHAIPPAPLCVNGRLFVHGKSSVMTYDAYNGTLLWERSVPGARHVDMRVEASDLAADDESLFIALDRTDRCVRLDARTGATVQTYSVPRPASDHGGRWGWVAVYRGQLFGSQAVSGEPHFWTSDDRYKRRKTWQNRSESVFALDMATGAVQWAYDGKDIANQAIALGDGKVLLVDDSAPPEQRRLALADRLRSPGDDERQPPGVQEAPDEVAVRLVVALDSASGERLWARPLDVTDCIIPSDYHSRILRSSGEINLIYKSGILLVPSFPYASKGGKDPGPNDSRRRTIALSAETGAALWSQATGHLTRPLVVGNTIYAEPWAFDLKTGEPRLRPDGQEGQQPRWRLRTGGCGPISASSSTLFFRKGAIAYHYLTDGREGHLSSLRPGCGINIIAANGLVLIPESSEGCECAWPIKCSLVLYHNGGRRAGWPLAARSAASQQEATGVE